ncbi:MAG: ABC-F family ATP-binding cassette domain-containing protein [Polyangiaceae bacterium]
MITVTGIAKAYGARTLFEDVSLKLTPGCRYGLVGANGSGKTTFLNLLSGDDTPTAGSISIPRTARTGVLRQDRFLNDDDSILDVASQGDTLVWEALAEQRTLAETGADPARIAELEERVRTHDGYTLEARASAILEGLGIPVKQHRMPLATLSGGFKLRVLLAQVLLGGPDIVFLDEPTNHLDILSIRWLEKFLAAYQGCAVVISHDQRFLDNVATHILDVDYATILAYPGNYTAFVREKQAIRERKEHEIEKAEAEIAHKRAYVERFRYKASKAAQAQSRLKQIEKIEVEELADTSRRAPRFSFVPERKSGRDVLTAESICKAYGEKQVLRDVGLVVRRGERVGVIGPNGLGKSTLLRILTGHLESDAGEVRWGHETRVGYFAQDHREVLKNPDATALDTLWAVRPREGNAFVRGHLGRVLFSGDDVQKRVGMLSGGEAARLVFACIAADQPNVLVLDEPTNHLDLESIAALVESLQSFEGTVLFVSHDRWFVSQLATRILEITPSGPRDFPGTYDEYLERCGDDHLDAEAVVLKARRDRKNDPEPAAPAATGASWEEQKKKRNRQKELPARRDRVMAAIESAEARKKAITDLYASEGFFERTPKSEIDALVAEEGALASNIDALMAEWEELETEIASLA